MLLEVSPVPERAAKAPDDWCSSRVPGAEGGGGHSPDHEGSAEPANRDALLRLGTALLAEQDDERPTMDRRYLTQMGSLRLGDAPAAG